MTRQFVRLGLLSKAALIAIFSTFFFCNGLGAAGDEPVILRVMVEGNKRIGSDAILRRCAYKKGRIFDPDLSASVIRKIDGLGYFSKISIEKEVLEGGVDLFIVVEEKQLVDGHLVEGNHHVTTQKILDRSGIRHKDALDEHDLEVVAAKIKALYREMNYHKATVKTELVPSEQSDDAVSLKIIIDEGLVSQVRQVAFSGVYSVPEWRLREALLTKELWLFGFADGSGKFNREMIEFDRRRIEEVYHNYGFIRARVVDVDIERVGGEEDHIAVRFVVDEGKQYKIRQVFIPYDNDIDEYDFHHAVTIKSGETYSQEAIRKVTERVRTLLGVKGFVNAEVYMPPRIDDDKQVVDLSFVIERGSKVHVNRINITGNLSTIDTVIRRELAFEEGDLLTSIALDSSKRRIESLGYFDREGVIWRFKRLSDELVDLELNVKEVKTGHFNLRAGVGGHQGRIGSGKQFGLEFGKRNLFGRGWEADMTVTAEDRRVGTFAMSFHNPYVLDSNIAMGLSLTYRSDEYDQWGGVTAHPVEQVRGGTLKLGCRLPFISRDVQWLNELGIEENKFSNRSRIVDEYKKLELTVGSSEKEQRNVLRYKYLLDRSLTEGVSAWIGSQFTYDTRNHYLYPSRGKRLVLNTKLALPSLNNQFSFMKTELKGSWFTPLIGERDLVLACYGTLGLVDSIDTDHVVPYRELFHMGGQDSVRGFVGGGAGPILVPEGELNERGNTPLGGRRKLQLNVELQMPMSEQHGMVGRLFFDAGCGWDTPAEHVPHGLASYIKRSDFNVRKSVGFGLSMVRPQPIKIDIGYKLDRDGTFNESEYEFHFGMNIPW